MRIKCILLMLLVAAMFPVVHAQRVDTFYLVVEVIDWRGNPITNVTVTLKQYSINSTVQSATNEQGLANFGSLSPDYYEVNVPDLKLSQGVYHRGNETITLQYGFWLWLSDAVSYAAAIRVAYIPLWLILLCVIVVVIIYFIGVRSG